MCSADGLRVYSTSPQSKDVDRSEYDARIAEVARWSEEAGCHGILVYTDNGIVDPWLVAQRIIEATERLRPLVAVQPAYMHPYSIAKMVASLAYLHGRAVDLNMLAGGFKNDLRALGDETEHDSRYERTVEYTQIVNGLLAGEAVTFQGRWYSVSNLRLTPTLPADLAPSLTISGSSPAGLEAAEQIGALGVRYPRPAAEEEQGLGAQPSHGIGIRVGVIARDDPDEAWDVAHRRFPEDRRGAIQHQMAMKVSDSHWHKDLSERSDDPTDDASPYWLRPFEQGQTFCPYLVGSHERVAQELQRYMAAGFLTFILDIPPNREELDHTGQAFALASHRTG